MEHIAFTEQLIYRIEPLEKTYLEKCVCGKKHFEISKIITNQIKPNYIMNTTINTTNTGVSNLLVLRHSSNSVGIVQAVTNKGNLIDVQPDSNSLDAVMRIDSSNQSFEDFYSKFYNQLENPSDYSFFKVQEFEAFETAKDLQDYIDESSEFERQHLKDYEVSIEAVERRRIVKGKGLDSGGLIRGSRSGLLAFNDCSEYRYQMDDIPWEALNKIGVNKEKLEEIGALDSMLKGHKTPMLVPIVLNNGREVHQIDARLKLKINSEGELDLLIHEKQNVDLESLYRGHIFSEEDKANLLKSGNMGRVVELANYATGELIPSLVSLDRLTNELFSLPLAFVRIPVVICGVQLSLEQQGILKEGKLFFVEDMMSKKGKSFDATLQFNAEKERVEFLFGKNLKCRETDGVAVKSSKEDSELRILENDFKRNIPSVFRGKLLRNWQMKKLKVGETAYIDGLVAKSRRKYQGYISYNFEKGMFEFSFKNPNRKNEDEKK